MGMGEGVVVVLLAGLLLQVTPEGFMPVGEGEVLGVVEVAEIVGSFGGCWVGPGV